MITTLILALLFVIVLGTTIWLFIVSFSLWQSSEEKTFYVNTPQNVAAQMLETLQPQKGQLLIDLGAGDGSIIRMAAQRYEIQSVGYEITLWPYLSSIFKNILFSWRHPDSRGLFKMRYQPALDADIHKAAYVFLYTSPTFNQSISQKLKRELPQYAQIVSLTFPLPNWTPKQEFEIDGMTYWLYNQSHKS